MENGPEKAEENMEGKEIRNWHVITRTWKEWRRIIVEAEVQIRR